MARRRALCSQAEGRPQDARAAERPLSPPPLTPTPLPFYTALAWTPGAETCLSFQGKLDAQAGGKRNTFTAQKRGWGPRLQSGLLTSKESRGRGGRSGMDGQEDTKCGCV